MFETEDTEYLIEQRDKWAKLAQLSRGQMLGLFALSAVSAATAALGLEVRRFSGGQRRGAIILALGASAAAASFVMGKRELDLTISAAVESSEYAEEIDGIVEFELGEMIRDADDET